ncbi:hypothetical protein [Chryseobacterium wanjuense]
MPKFWNNTNKIAVMVDELVPRFWSSQNVLSTEISRNRNNPYGIKSLQRGCRNRKLLIDFDSLPENIQDALGDPRKVEHELQNYYRTDSVAVDFYTMFRRPDGNALIPVEQKRYITNASILIALIHLREQYISERMSLGMSLKGINGILCNSSNSFNRYLERKNAYS